MSNGIPEGYLEFLERDTTTTQQTVNNPYAGSTSFLQNMGSPTTSLSQIDEEGTALWDFFSGAAGGVASGITWGVSEGFGDKSLWEDMSGAERAGWIMGEGMSYFIPYIGPFGLLGKGLRTAPKLLGANKYIDEATELAIKSLDNLSPKDARKVQRTVSEIATKTGQSTDQVMKGISSSARSGLSTAAKSNLGARWIRDLDATGVAAVNAAKNVQTSAAYAMQQAFKKNGIEMDIGSLNKASQIYADALKEGKYVEDVAQWVGRGLSSNLNVSDNVATYLGMATQDLILMGIHGMGSAAIKANIHGTELHPGEVMWHSVGMALMFPAIRAFGKGGSDNLTTGMKAYMQRYLKTNYKQIEKEHGMKTLENLLRVQLGPVKKDIINRNRMADTIWKVKNKDGSKAVYQGGDDILNKLEAGKVPKEHVYQLLNNIKQVTSKELLSKWRGKYVVDLAQSMPRMAIGVVATNPWVIFNPQSFGEMESSEIGAHLFMSAMMTKSKGAWGHKEQAMYRADFTPYYEVLADLGVNVNNIKQRVKFRENREPIMGTGQAIHSTVEGKEIMRIIDSELKQYSSKDPSGFEVGNRDHSRALELGNMYNIMKIFLNPDASVVDFKTLDSRTLSSIGSRLGKIRFKSDDVTFKELGVEGVMSRLTIEPAERTLNMYKEMLLELHNIGYDVEIGKDNKLIFRAIGGENEHIGSAMMVNELLRELSFINEAKQLSGEKTIKEILKDPGNKFKNKDEFYQATDRIIGKYMEAISNEFEGKFGIIREPVKDNPIFDFVKKSKEVQAAERVYSILSGKKTGDKKDENLTASLDRLFQLSDGKYADSIYDYAKLFKGFNPDAKEAKDIAAHDKILDHLADLEPLFNMRKSISAGNHLSGNSSRKTSEKGNINSLSITELEAAAKPWGEIRGQLTERLKFNFNETMQDLFVNRLLKGRAQDRRAVGLAKYLIHENVAIVGKDGKLHLPEWRALERELYERKERGEVTENNIKEMKDAHRVIRRVLGEDLISYDKWAPTTTDSQRLTEVELDQYMNAVKMLKDQEVTDFLLNANTKIKEITDSNVNTGMRQRVKELTDKINVLVEGLNPEVSTARTADPVKEIETIKEQLFVLAEGLKGSKKSSDDLKNVALYLDKLLADNLIDFNTGKFRVRMDEMVEGVDKYKIDENIVLPLNAIMKGIFNKETQGINDMKSLIVKIQNMITNPNKGLEKSEVHAIIEGLTKEWYKKYKNSDKELESITFTDLLEAVNEKGSFGDAINLVAKFEQMADRAIFISNEHNPLNLTSFKASQSLLEGSKIHEHHTTPIEILRDLGLIESNGSINEQFRLDLIKDPANAIETTIKDGLYANAKNSIEGRKSWIDFKRKHAMPLISMINNSRPVNTVRLEGQGSGNQARGVARFTYNKPHLSNPATDYMFKTRKTNAGEDHKYQIFYVEDNMSVSFRVGGKLRNVSIDRESNPNVIQEYFNNAFRDANKKTLLEMLENSQYKLDPSEKKLMLEVPQDYLFYVRTSPKDKMLFVASERNIEILNKEYQSWYDKTLYRYEQNDKKMAESFKKTFGELMNNATDRTSVELKLMLPYLNELGRRNEFDNWIKESRTGNESKLAKIEANLFKRGFLSDGGTTQKFSKELFSWAANNHFLKPIKDAADHYVKQDGYNVLPIADETVMGISKNGLGIKNIALEALAGSLGAEGKKEIRRLLRQQTDDVNSKDPNVMLKSLESSLIDGAKFASERLMRLVMASKGQDGSFGENANGAKTIIYATGDNQMLGKGFLIYHPDIAKHMPKDVDILLGESSAKTLSGQALSQKEIKKLDLTHVINSKDNFAEGIPSQYSKDNLMRIPLDAIGASFTSKNVKGVNISQSIFDFQKANVVKDAIDFMNFKQALGEVATQWIGVDNNPQVAQYIYKIIQQGGNPLDRGDSGLSKILFQYGAMPENPWVNSALRRMVRNGNYETLSKRPNLRGGEDNFIVPNINADLSMPLYGRSAVEAGSLNRVTLRYGGIGLNAHTMSRAIGKGGKNASNLEGETFIFRSSNGVDILTTVENGKVKFFSQLSDNIVQYKKEFQLFDYRLKGKDSKNKDTEFDARTISDYSKDAPKIEKVLKEINKISQDHELTLNDVFNILANPNGTRKRVYGTNSYKRLVLKKEFRKIVDELNLQLGAMNHAVPTLGYDKIIMRVEKVLENMNGLAEVNSWDLRTVMQRDNDGDHLYTHTKLPWSIMKAFARENGKIDDFRMFNTTDVLNKDYINIFGVGPNGRAGELVNSVGFHKYASTLNNAKMAIGSTIGNRNALSWLAKLDLGSMKNGKHESLLSPLLSGDFSKNHKKGWEALVKYFDVMQNSVDIHGGIHKLLQDKSALQDWLLFGRIPTWLDPKSDAVLIKHMEAAKTGMVNPDFTLPGKKSIFGEKHIEREMFKEILKTLRDINMMSNDTWDEKGSRNPEPDELKTAFYDIKGLFSNPTEFLARKMVKRIGMERDFGVKTKLSSQYLDTFYPGQYDVKTEKGRSNLYKDIVKGKNRSLLQEIFQFKGFGDDPMKAFDQSINGYVIKELLKNKNFWERNYENIGDRSLDANLLNEAGVFVRNIESFVQHSRLFGDNPVDAYKKMDMDIDISNFGTNFSGFNVKPGIIKKALNNGILRELVNYEYSKTLRSMEYFRSQKFTDPNKLDRLKNRLSDLGQAVDIMDVQVARDMLLTKDRAIVKGTDTQKKYLQKQDRIQKTLKGKAGVYRIRGNATKLKDKPEDARALEWQMDGRDIDYGQMEFVGYYDKKGRIGGRKKDLFFEKGYTYVIDKQPLQHINLGTNEMRYGLALFKATYGDVYSPHSFIKNGSPGDFIREAYTLRKTINYDYSRTMKSATGNRVLSDDIYALQRSREMNQIDSFVQKWINKVDPNFKDPLDVILRHIIKPEVAPMKYATDHLGRDVPAFKSNMHLIKTVFQYAENTNQSHWVKSVVKDVENYASGRAENPDISFYDRANFDKFNFKAFGDMAGPLNSMSKYMNIFFTSPLLDAQMKKVLPTYKGPVKIINGPDNVKIPVRNHRKYSEIEKQGKDC